MHIEVLFVTKDGCGLCHMMESAWKRLPAHKPWWAMTHLHLTKDNPEESKKMIDMGVDRTPSWVVLRDGLYAGHVSGGMKLITLIKKLDAIVG